MAAPAVATTATDLSTSLGTNNAHTLPTGSTSGNLILVLVVHDSTTMPTASTGWTALTAGETNGGYTARWFARVLDGGANDTLTVSGAAQDHISGMLRITGHGVSNAALPGAIRFATPVNTTATTTPDPPAANISDARDWLIVTATTLETAATGTSVSAAPTNYTTNAMVGTSYRSANSTSAVALGIGFRQLTNASTENPGTFTSTSRPYIAYTLAIAPPVTATASAPLGGMTGSATANVTHPPVTATASAPLGSLTGSASATVYRSATFDAPLGGLSASASATVTPAVGAVTAVADAALGGCVGSASATVSHAATADAPLGGLNGSATATVSHAAAAAAPLDGLTAAATATVLHVVQATADAPLGALQAPATATVSHAATADAPLGGMSATATATGGTAVEAQPDDGSSHSYGRPRPRKFEQPRRLPPPVARHNVTGTAPLGALAATAIAVVTWSVIADEDDLLALL